MTHEIDEMTVSFVQFYVSANALLMVALALLLGLRAISARLRRTLSYRHQLQFGYVLIGAAILGPWLALSSLHGNFLPKTTQVWSAESMHVPAERAASARGATVSLVTSSASVPLDTLTQVAFAVCLGGFLFAAIRVLSSAWSTGQVLRRAQLIRHSGALRIFSSDDADIPFAFWLPGRYYIVVPSCLIVRPDDLRVALRHEAQHHRHGDTRILYAIQLLKGAFFLNPALHVLCRRLRELQEFACDEALAGRRSLTARAYCNCLLWVARNARSRRHYASCMQMADENGESMLARRIEALLREPGGHLKRSVIIALNAVAVLAIIATGLVLPGTVEDRRISFAQATGMAAVAQAGTSFPIVVNESVVEELNRLLGTPDGRAFVSASLRRMSAHEPLITRKLAEYGLPAELLAVPIVESGYRNLPQDGNPGHGAGLWMFIEPTARRFGLTVDATADERLDIELETEAAMQMLSRLHSDFKDWGLALLAYNGGRDMVHRGVRETGTRDAFQLVRKGYEQDPGYVPRMMAAIIVLKNSHAL